MYVCVYVCHTRYIRRVQVSPCYQWDAQNHLLGIGHIHNSKQVIGSCQKKKWKQTERVGADSRRAGATEPISARESWRLFKWTQGSNSKGSLQTTLHCTVNLSTVEDLRSFPPEGARTAGSLSTYVGHRLWHGTKCCKLKNGDLNSVRGADKRISWELRGSNSPGGTDVVQGWETQSLPITTIDHVRDHQRLVRHASLPHLVRHQGRNPQHDD